MKKALAALALLSLAACESGSPAESAPGEDNGKSGKLYINRRVSRETLIIELSNFGSDIFDSMQTQKYFRVPADKAQRLVIRKKYHNDTLYKNLSLILRSGEIQSVDI